MISRYGFEDYRKAAIENPSEENLATLATWFRLYGDAYWNGEYWDADGYELRPVFDENDDEIIVGYELR